MAVIFFRLYVNKKALLLLLVGSLTACNAPDQSGSIQKPVDAFLKEHSAMHAIYKVDDLKQHTLAQGARGLSNVERQIPLSLNEITPVASVTKQMTAALILKLEEQGKLSTNDPISKHLPATCGLWPQDNMPEWANQITIHNLLTHTGGIADYVMACKFTGTENIQEIQRIIFSYAATHPVLLPIGKEYKYSNTGYVILGAIIERITNDSLANVMQKELFEPLGMTHTHLASPEEAFAWQLDKPGHNLTFKGYFGVPKDQEIQLLPARLPFFLVPFADGGVLSCADDLLIWNKALHGGKVLTQASYQKMIYPYLQDTDKSQMKYDVRVGYGIKTYTIDGVEAYCHPGSTVGIRAELCYLNKPSMSFAILSNLMPAPFELTGVRIDFSKHENQFDIRYLRDAIINYGKQKQ